MKKTDKIAIIFLAIVVGWIIGLIIDVLIR